MSGGTKISLHNFAISGYFLHRAIGATWWASSLRRNARWIHTPPNGSIPSDMTLYDVLRNVNALSIQITKAFSLAQKLTFT